MPRGTAYDQGKLLEEALNKKLATGHLQIQVHFVPMSRDEIIPALLEGRGDIVMADLTVTPERLKTVNVTEPWIAGVDEIVVTSPDGPEIGSVDDLSGKEVFVRRTSSYFRSLEQLNERFKAEGKPLITLTPAPEELEDEDLSGDGLCLAGQDPGRGQSQSVVLAARVADAETAPGRDAAKGGEIAWAIRKDAPEARRPR